MNKGLAASSTFASVLLMGTAAVGVPAQMALAAPDANVALQEAKASEATTMVAASAVQGQFSFTQAAVSSNAAVKAAFQKAAAALCNTLATYDLATVEDNPIELLANGGAVHATLAQVEDEAGTTGTIMTCACTANGVGGAAIANAQVAGVSIDNLAMYAGVTL